MCIELCSYYINTYTDVRTYIRTCKYHAIALPCLALGCISLHILAHAGARKVQMLYMLRSFLQRKIDFAINVRTHPQFYLQWIAAKLLPSSSQFELSLAKVNLPSDRRISKFVAILFMYQE